MKVKYLVVGGMAVNFHGYNRVTGDLDIVLLLEDSNLKKFIQVAKKFDLRPRVPVQLKDFADIKQRTMWIKEKNMKAFALCNPKNALEHVDVIIDHKLSFKTAYEARQVLDAGDYKVSLISLGDLVSMKKSAGRLQDQLDVQALQAIKEIRDEK